jgi:hypothetical protein
MSRVRFVSATVQLQLVNDDGDTLAPIVTQPLVIHDGAWPPDLHALITDVDRQVNGPSDETSPADG